MKTSIPQNIGALAMAFLLKGMGGPEYRSRRHLFEKKSTHRPSGGYVAGGPNPNVRGTYVRNPKVAAQMNTMHEKWLGVVQESKPASPV